MTDDAPAPARTGPPPGRARLSTPAAAKAEPAPVAAPDPVVDVPVPVEAAVEPTSVPAPAPNVEPAAPTVTRGQPPGRARIAPRVIASIVPEPVEAAPEPTPEPAAPDVPTPTVEPASAPRGPAPGRARLSAPRVPLVRVSQPVGRVSRDGTASTERVVPRASRDPIVRAAKEAREAAIDRELREADLLSPDDVDEDDVVIGEPDPESAPVRVAPSVTEELPSWTMVTYRHTNLVAHYRRPDRIGPVLPMSPDKFFVGPKGFADDRDVPF